MPAYVSGAAFFTRGFDTDMVKEDLLSQNDERQLSAMQQVIAFMTVGKDMSGLFNEVAALTSSTNVTIKRLAYLYLMENSLVQPEKAVLQAGTFVKDTLNDSPLVRGAALRTMTGLQLSVMNDFASGPVRRCLEDSEAYVRRIAVVGGLKQYCTSTSLGVDSGLLDQMIERLQDNNPSVVAAAVLALMELYHHNAPTRVLRAIAAARGHLLDLLDTATEWATYGLLEGVALSYDRSKVSESASVGNSQNTSMVRRPRGAAGASTALDDTDIANGSMLGASANNSSLRRRSRSDAFVRDFDDVAMRVLPYVSMANTAVVMAAIKVLAMGLWAASDESSGVTDSARGALDARFVPRIVRALLSLLQAPRFEMRYVALRNVLLFLSSPRFQPYFTRHLAAFLIKYEDPIYIKLEKLEVLVQLASEANGQQVLSELVVYAKESDVELVRRSIRSIGTLASALPSLSADCVKQLEVLIFTKVPHIVEAAAVVVQTVLRRYPGKFLDVIPTLCDALTVVKDVDSIAAVAWVIGEYPFYVTSVKDYVSFFLESFSTQPRLVQLAVLTALVKMHVRGSAKDSPMKKDDAARVLSAVETVLGLCTSGATTPDLRDRAFFYWRLLADDLPTAQRVLSREAQAIPHLTSAQERRARQDMIRDLGQLVSVLHRPLHVLFGSVGDNEDEDEDEPEDDEHAVDKELCEEAVGGSAEDASAAAAAGAGPSMDASGPGQSAAQIVLNSARAGGLAASLLPPSRSLPPEGSPTSSSSAGAGAAFNLRNMVATNAFTVVLSHDIANGVEVGMKWGQMGSKLVLSCRFQLHSGPDYVHHARVTNLQMNWNMFGIGVSQIFPTTNLEPDDKPAECGLIIAVNNQKRPTREVQVALEVEPIGVRYFLAPPIPPVLLLLPATGGCDVAVFVEQFKAFAGPTWRMPPQVSPVRCDAARLTANVMRVLSLSVAYRKEDPTQGFTSLFLYAETIARQRLLFELTVQNNVILLLTVRCEYAPVAAFFGEFVQHSLGTL